MKYHWLDCPRCGCQIAVNYSPTAAGISGSLRRWSADRSINDGRPISIAAPQAESPEGLTVECVCGEAIRLPAVPDAVGAERDPDLRVDLHEV
ncbi:MAG TPA: hypothetical protein VIZ58_04575 [Thermoanaerobaculia bacterium]